MNNQIKAIRDALYLFSVYQTLNLDNVTSMLFRFSFEILLAAAANIQVDDGTKRD